MPIVVSYDDPRLIGRMAGGASVYAAGQDPFHNSQQAQAQRDWARLRPSQA